MLALSTIIFLLTIAVIFMIIKITYTVFYNKKRQNRLIKVKHQMKLYLHTADKNLLNTLKEIISREYIVDRNIFPLHDNNPEINESQLLKDKNEYYTFDNKKFCYYTFPRENKLVEFDAIFLEIITEECNQKTI